MSRLTIQAAIIAALESVPGVENVYPDLKIVPNIDTFILTYVQKDQDYVQTWTVSRVKSDPRTAESTNFRAGIPLRVGVHLYHTFEIELWVGVRDPSNESGQANRTSNLNSETHFQTLCDAALETFISKRSLGGTTTEKPLSLESTRYDSLNKVMCKVGRFELTIVDMRNDILPV